MWSLFIFIFTFTLVNLQNVCKTPNNEDGDCISIRNCSVLLSVLQEKPLSQTSREFLQKSNCGFENLDPKVCCPKQIKNITVLDENKSIFYNSSQCGIIIDDKIVGGLTTDLNEFPWMTLLITKDDNETSYNCAGVILNNRYVLTAAHCLRQVRGQVVGIRFGEYNLKTEVDCVDVPFTKYCTPPPFNLEIQEMHIHPQYNLRTKQHNIGLARVAKDIPFSDFIQPICLPTSQKDREETYIGKSAIVVGWGRTAFIEGAPSDVILKVELPIVNNEQCSKVFSNTRVVIDNTHLCAGGNSGQDSCSGDSGGPLMIINKDETGEPHWYAIGIVSYGKACGIADVPGVYTRITEYIDWIFSTMKP